MKVSMTDIALSSEVAFLFVQLSTCRSLGMGTVPAGIGVWIAVLISLFAFF